MPQMPVIPIRLAVADGPSLKLPSLPKGDFYRFHAMVKPSGAQCNLDCAYCFYLHKEESVSYTHLTLPTNREV